MNLTRGQVLRDFLLLKDAGLCPPKTAATTWRITSLAPKLEEASAFWTGGGFKVMESWLLKGGPYPRGSLVAVWNLSEEEEVSPEPVGCSCLWFLLKGMLPCPAPCLVSSFNGSLGWMQPYLLPFTFLPQERKSQDPQQLPAVPKVAVPALAFGVPEPWTC